MGITFSNEERERIQSALRVELDLNGPKVHNLHHKTAPPDAVYIGRPSIWGNPYSHRSDTLAEFRVGTTETALLMYAAMMLRDPKLIAKARRQLKGKDLVCFCKPGPCHGDILMKIANSKGDEW